ncbi:ParA family protein [Saccharopolyspora sp. NPDC000359]|uniref:ParA family protein n=1 Tax=Saccharopolyspora sp. NPDC000359 TaxID=3154251 RepID=UPI00331F4C4C
MRIYAISNQKGGVGKTVTAKEFGAALAEAGRRVLLIDFDPQGHLTTCLNVAPAGSGPGDANLPKALLGKWSGSLGELIHEISPGLFVIPTCDEMFLLEAEMYGRSGREYLLSRFLDQLLGLIDDVCIDCPPSLGPLNDAALVAARDRDAENSGAAEEDDQITGRIIIPVESEDSSIGALRLILRQISSLEQALPGVLLAVAGLVVNMYDSRRGRIATSTLNAFKAHPLGVLAVINQRAAITEAWRAKQTVLVYAPDSESAQQFRGLARAIDPRLPELQEHPA